MIADAYPLVSHSNARLSLLAPPALQQGKRNIDRGKDLRKFNSVRDQVYNDLLSPLEIQRYGYLPPQWKEVKLDLLYRRLVPHDLNDVRDNAIERTR